MKLEQNLYNYFCLNFQTTIIYWFDFLYRYNFALEYAIRKVQETNLGLDMNGTRQVLAYADDVNLIGDDISQVEFNYTYLPLVLEWQMI